MIDTQALGEFFVTLSSIGIVLGLVNLGAAFCLRVLRIGPCNYLPASAVGLGVVVVVRILLPLALRA